MEDSLLLVEEIIVFLIVLFGLLLGFWVWTANKKERFNQWFFIMAVSVVFWVVFASLGFSTKNASLSVFFYRLNWGAVALFLLSAFYFYIIHFLNYGEVKKYRIFGKFILSAGIVLIALSIFTGAIIKKTIVETGGTEIVFGPANNLFNIYAFSITLLVIGLLIKKYFQMSRQEKLKTEYFLIGTTLFAVSNIIFNIVSPMLTKTVAYQHFGDYSAIFLLGFTAYAIVKRELFGIRIVLTTLFVGLIAILLFLDALVFTQSFPLQIIKGSILLMFLAFGYSLIQSVLREIKLREELQAAYQKLDELDKAKSEFISIASHQLRTPLTAIKGYVSMILGGSYGKVDQKSKQPLENVYKSSQRLINLVNDLLSISKIEAGKMELEIERGSLEEIVMSVFEELKIEAEKKKIYLKWEKPEKDLPDIFIDTDKIRQVILNLIDNDIKYTSKGGITMKAETINNDIKIMISDTGEGMTKEELAKIFSSFSRGEAGTQLFTEGAGLGLYVARKFVEMHQGRIWAESKGKGKGSQFFIILPIFRESLRQFLKDM